MNDREPKIGDVIRELNPPVVWWCNHIPVEAVNVDDCRYMVASGRWVIVDPQPAGEPGPASDTSTTREGES